jgi:voltage-gated potassium channel
MDRLERWESRAETPLTVAALAFLVAYALPIAWTSVPHTTHAVCDAVIVVTWIGFGVDYLVRLVLAPRTWHFVEHNVLDLLVIALPVLRPLRLLRLVALLSVLNRVGAHTFRGRVVTYVLGGSAMLVLTAALAVTDAERGRPGSTIANLGDGFWWAFSTMSTVGYGDRVPVTPTGRAIAVGLMLGGVALVGAVTATLASWLVERVGAGAEVEEAATRVQVEALVDEVRALRAQLAGMAAHGSVDGPANGSSSSGSSTQDSSANGSSSNGSSTHDSSANGSSPIGSSPNGSSSNGSSPALAETAAGDAPSVGA